MRKSLLFVLTACLCCGLSAQEWVTLMQDPHANFYKVRSSFDAYFAVRDKTEKGKGYKAFRRWANFVEPRVYPSGNLSQLRQTATNFEKFQQNYMATSNHKVIGGGNMIASTTWTAMGPFGALSGSAGGQLLKSGRLNFITIDPTNTLNLWVGAPAGGLWKSTNGGSSWTTGTDNLGVIGCSDLAIDPTNTSVMYLATGDGDAGDTPSIGILKTTDGGVTWNTTGLTFNKANNVQIRRVIINPASTQTVLAATNQGIYRTINGGTSWSQVASGQAYDLEFKPGDPNTVYAGGANFKLSTNGGASFTAISSGITTTGVNRMAVAVTAADPTYVYVLASSSSSSGFYGFYRSTSSGTSFSQITTTLNLLGWSSTGSDTGGQGWYDLCIAASPLNKDEVVVGGVNVWRTTTGGSSWSIYGHWTGSGAPFTHADHHDLEYDVNGVLYDTNDGTVYRRGSTTWAEIAGTMNISQIYRIGLSSLTANKWITGHQDNGTNIYNGSSYYATMGGDGMDCFIDRTNDNTMYAEYYDGDLRRSFNGGGSWASCVTGLTGTAPWVTIWKQDPQVANTLYCGYTNLFVSTNQGTSWTQLSALPGTGTIREFAIAPSNNQVIYVLKSSGIYKTTNGGTNWNTVTGTVPVGSAAPEYICIDPNDPNNAWVVLSGYSAGNKVFVTYNGGSSWTNISGNLPNIPANCCVYQTSTNDRIYIGMDIGVYYSDNSSPSWTLYNTGLPNVPVSELQISPANNQRLHASTFGRGVWVVSVAPPVSAPASAYTAPTVKCTGASLTFTDQSTNSPTSWSWSVSPSGGVSANSFTVQNPTFSFSAPGTYTISVQAGNSVGPGNVYSTTVVISSSPVILVSPGAASICSGSPVTFSASGASSYTWSNGGGNGTAATYTPALSSVYSVTGAVNGCTTFSTVNVTAAAAPSIVVSGGTITCAGSPTVLTATGANTYSWSNSTQGSTTSVAPMSTTAYSVVGSNGGCTSMAAITVSVLPLPGITVWSDRGIACVGDSVNMFGSGAATYTWLPLNGTGNPFGFIAASALNFTVMAADSMGCIGSAEIQQDVAECVNVVEQGFSGQLRIFPNPVSSRLGIDFHGHQSTDITVSICDLTGRELRHSTLRFGNKAYTQFIDVSTLPAGVYMVGISNGDVAPTHVRVVKE